ncbi:hypothetical protein MBLNU457_g2615t1 [Dothideomycetes sp. NU457]
MSQHDPSHWNQHNDTYTAAVNTLGPDAYTSLRLQHATAEHLHLTTRRCFIGPIPEGWLKAHRKEWYKHYLHIHHSSKAPSFNAGDDTGRQRQMTAIDGGRIRPSFPQPKDAAEESAAIAEAAEDEADGAGDIDIEAEPDAAVALPQSTALELPRVQSNPDEDAPREMPKSVDAALSSYTSAPERALSSLPRSDKSKRSRSNTTSPTTATRKTSATSFVTAHSEFSDDEDDLMDDDSDASTPKAREVVGLSKLQTAASKDATDEDILSPERASSSVARSPNTAPDSPKFGQQSSLRSTTSLLGKHNQTQVSDDREQRATTDDPVAAQLQDKKGHATFARSVPEPDPISSTMGVVSRRGPVRFAEPEVDVKAKKVEYQFRARLAQAAGKRLPRSFTRGRFHNGEIVKMEKMLVRYDMATGAVQPEIDFDEKDNQRVDTRVVEKWREFMVVCRQCDDEKAALTLQMYKTRVIPATSQSKVKKRFKHEILLDRTNVKVNLYSSLDKTIVLWMPKGPRTDIYFLNCRSSTSAVEWFHFLRQCLGLRRDRTIQVNIPDLSACIRLDNPFDTLNDPELLAKAADGDEEALAVAMKNESAIGAIIVERCLQMLNNNKEWSSVLKTWAGNDRIGLAWKRYDRLEWVHGTQERKMYGSMAMLRTHDLELRQKEHYPMRVKSRRGHLIDEPPPVEGFLIRLTSQKGAHQKLGKLFYKRLYFTSQNQYLLFLRPTKTKPPPPPKMPMSANSKIPSSKQIAEKIPLIFAVNPYPLENDTISWLRPHHGPSHAHSEHDTDAADEADRNSQAVLDCDGFINMCDIVKIRKVKRGATPADQRLDEGEEVDFDIEVPNTLGDDGETSEMDDHRTFEVVLKNNLVIRLQAFNKDTKKEWMRRLRDLVKYWTLRVTADTDLFKSVRRQNLTALNIDERAEAYIGQFANKWEVTKSFASASLYHMCGISSCRTVINSGVLYRKPRLHATFTKCHVLLAQGHLIIFRDTLRTAAGRREAHIHHDRIASIDLRDCYLYSGLITENDLLYQNRTFDANAPGNTALPRVFLEDHWTSTDEDAMATFVLWHGQSKSWFKSEVDDVRAAEATRDKDAQREAGGRRVRTKLKRVNQLGVKGRSVVFKARSRAERDHWVTSISTEIERLVAQEQESERKQARVVEGSG